MTAADRLEILDLIGRYSFAADTGSAEDYAAVFTDDGEFVGRTGQPDEIHVRGREKLLKFAGNVGARRTADTQTRHQQSGTTFLALTATTAVTRTYLCTTTVRGDADPFIGLTSIYEDHLVKTADGWRIAQRRTLPDVQGTLAITRQVAEEELQK